MQDRFRFRVWDKLSKRYFFLELKFGDNGYHPRFIEKPDFEQCTGLKDKNGKLIYEGDILYSPLDNGTKKVIFWDNGLARFQAYNGKDKKFTQGIGDAYFIELDFEVIGNIHENADLLGEDE